MTSHAILLAAGASRRMGRAKAWQDFRGQPWAHWQTDRVLGAIDGSVVLVVQEPTPELEVLLQQAQPRVRSAFNPEVDSGPFVSLQAGLEVLLALAPKNTDTVFVLPIDVPAAEPAVWRALADLSTAEVQVPRYGDRNGHPVAFTIGVARELASVDPHAHDARLDHQLRHYKSRLVAVADANVSLNLNDASAWAAFNAAG